MINTLSSCHSETRADNRTGAFDQDCLDAHSEEEAWMCSFPQVSCCCIAITFAQNLQLLPPPNMQTQYTYPYITTPMFIIQSKYDRVGIMHTLKVDCLTCQDNSHCMAECSDEETEAIHGFSEVSTGRKNTKLVISYCHAK